MNGIRAIIQRNLLSFVRDRGRLFGSIVMSFFMLFVFSFVMGGSTGVTQPMNYLISGIIIMAVFQTSLSNGTEILTDIASGYMKEVLVAPIPRTQISVGHILSGTIIACIQGVMITFAGLFMGLKLSPVQFLEMLGVMAVAGVAFGAIGLYLATITRNSSSYQIISSMVTMPLTFLSGAYIPTMVMPKFLLPIVYLNPLTYITSIFRYISLNMEGLTTVELIKQGVAFDLFGFVITPFMGLVVTAVIGTVFIFLSVQKFREADFTSVKVARRGGGR